MADKKILNIRGVDESVHRRFSAGAAARGITQAEYLRRLLDYRDKSVSLVWRGGEFAEDSVTKLAALLESLELDPVLA